MADGDITPMKRCTKCGVEQEKSAFTSDKKKPDGLRSHCRKCVAAWSATWYAANRDKALARYNAWRKKNPDHVKAKHRAYYEANKEAALLQHKTWYRENRERSLKSSRDYYARTIEYQKNRAVEYRSRMPDEVKDRIRKYSESHRERFNATSRKWAKENAGRHRAHRAKRRASESMATPAWVDLEEIAAIYNAARELELQTGTKMHVDHVVPIQHPLVCGLHVPANLMVIADIENRRKGNRHWPDMP